VTLIEALIATRKTLTARQIEDPDIDAELLLRHATGRSKDNLYAQYNDEVTGKESLLLDGLIQRRLKGEPIAYILGYKEFFGLKFNVNRSVLIPRPETEMLVEKAIDISRQQNVGLIADVGTGCGAIAISLAKRLPNTKIYATDISVDALEVAITNCKKNGVDENVHILHGNLLEPIPEAVDLIVANMPYVRDVDWSNLSTKIKSNEPKSALAGGSDGLDAITGLLAKAKGKLRPNGAILLEIGYDQGKAALKLAKNYFPKAKAEICTDLAGLDRVISIKTEESDVPTFST